MKIVYEAFDGEIWDTAEQCKAHEAKSIENGLAGLTIEQVQSAMSRTDVPLADLFEKVGAQIARARLASGERKRGRKGEVAAAQQGAANGAASGDAAS